MWRCDVVWCCNGVVVVMLFCAVLCDVLVWCCVLWYAVVGAVLCDVIVWYGVVWCGLWMLWCVVVCCMVLHEAWYGVWLLLCIVVMHCSVVLCEDAL